MRATIICLASIGSAVAFSSPHLDALPSLSGVSTSRVGVRLPFSSSGGSRGDGRSRVSRRRSSSQDTATTPAELNPATSISPPSSSAAAVAVASRKTARVGSAPVLTVEGDTIETLPIHVALVGSFTLLSAYALGPTVAAFADGGPAAWLTLGGIGFATLVFSDFFSGVFHWATDNYGNGKTPVFGGVIEAFQGHHGNPWTITHRGFCNNVHKIAKAALPLLALGMAATSDPGWRLVMVIFLNAQMLSQEFHKLSHEVSPPAWAAWLQDRNLIISRKVHGMHHKPPFEAHYCILTGWCNPWLDKRGLNLWRRLEAGVYRLNGQAPNCWGEPGGEGLKKEALAL